MVVNLNTHLSAFAKEKCAWQDCDAGLAAAIAKLVELWGPYTTQSRGRNLAGLFGKIIGPAWSAYFNSLPAGHPARLIGAASELNLHTAARNFGFSGVRLQLERVVLAIYPKDETQDTPDLGDFIVTIGRKSSRAVSATHIFSQTIESLITLASLCEMKRSKSTTKEIHGINPNRGLEFCSFCGAKTEVRTFLEAENSYREKLWRHVDGKLVPKLSNKYCVDHRPVDHEGRSSAAYHQARRAREHFEQEARRLTKQSFSTSKRLSSSGSTAIEQFYLSLIRQEWPDPGEHGRLRDCANELTLQRVSDRKKFVVSLRAAGLTQAEIGRRAGMSQQAVHKALSSLPKNYRFDEVNAGK